MTKPPFRDWFNLDNPVHRAAYLHFRKAGVWPSHLHPSEHCDMEPLWTVVASEKYIDWLEKELDRYADMLEQKERMWHDSQECPEPDHPPIDPI